jgi:hypothetical protein
MQCRKRVMLRLEGVSRYPERKDPAFVALVERCLCCSLS